MSCGCHAEVMRFRRVRVPCAARSCGGSAFLPPVPRELLPCHPLVGPWPQDFTVDPSDQLRAGHAELPGLSGPTQLSHFSGALSKSRVEIITNGSYGIAWEAKIPDTVARSVKCVRNKLRTGHAELPRLSGSTQVSHFSGALSKSRAKIIANGSCGMAWEARSLAPAVLDGLSQSEA